MQHPGGVLLAASLDGGDTIRFFPPREESATNLASSSLRNAHPTGWVLFFGQLTDLKIEMPQSGGLRRDALQLWWFPVMTAFWVAAVVTWVQRWEQAPTLRSGRGYYRRAVRDPHGFSGSGDGGFGRRNASPTVVGVHSAEFKMQNAIWGCPCGTA